ncbi:hypothetical protein ACM614_10915 [Streptomyces sp. 12297]|uniref:hypothetical protein n=1 Tax=Streptomyces sp. NBC_00239 TaxID=2903640 RepID=UPI002E2B5B56|nr:hypothetical protein [Streptomyces sp. NBC_00239]
MALDARWQDLFDPDGAGDGLSLASASASPDGGSGGSGGAGGADLKADPAPWSAAGAVANALQGDTGTALTELGTAHEGVAAGTAGFASTAALDTIRGSWQTRLGAVRDECGRLAHALVATGKDFGEREDDTARTMREAGRP